MDLNRATRGLLGTILVFSNILATGSIFVEDSNLNLLRADSGASVQFLWRIDEEFHEHVPFRFLFQRYNQRDQPGMKQTIFQYEQGTNHVTNLPSNYENRVRVLKGARDYVGFNLTDVQSTDAGLYICIYTTFSDPPESTKTLFVWGKLERAPTVTQIADERPALRCEARATSVPEENRTGMEYQWQTTSGSPLTAVSTDTVPVDEALGSVGAGQGPVGIVCLAREVDSPKPFERSNVIELTRPELTRDGSDAIVREEGRRDTATLKWWYVPESLEGARIVFQIRFQKANSDTFKVVYTKQSTDPVGTISSEFRHKFSGIEGNSSLGVSVNDVSLEDAGLYTAIATNVMSLDLRDDILIVVQSSPTKPQVTLIRRDPINGGQAVLECGANSSSLPESHRQPLQWRWLRGDTVITADGDHYTTKSNRLTINALEDGDFGPPFSCDVIEESAPPALRSEQSEAHYFNATIIDEPVTGPKKQVEEAENTNVTFYVYIAVGVVVGVLLITLLILVISKVVRSKRSQYYHPTHVEVSDPILSPPSRGQLGPPPGPPAGNDMYMNPTPTNLPEMNFQPRAAAPLPEIYLHPLEKNPSNLMVGEIIHPGPCYTLRCGTVVGEPEDKVAFKRITAENWVDSKKFDDVKTILLSQIAAMRVCSFDKVIKFMGCVIMNDPLTCITEFAPLGNLQSQLCRGRKPRKSVGEEHHYSPMSYLELLVYVRDVAAAMQYLHSSKVSILHPYLCTSHVLVFSGPMCKVTGFMLEKDIRIKHRLNIATKETRPRRWMAPETLQNLEHTAKSDVWSFGVLLWETFTFGRTPYPDLMDDAVLPFIKSGKRMSKPDICKDDMFDAMNQCWMLTPENRPPFSQLLRQIQNVVDKETDTYACISFPRAIAADNNEVTGNEYMTPRDCRPLSMFAEQTAVKQL